jgi:hypothetical protein
MHKEKTNSSFRVEATERRERRKEKISDVNTPSFSSDAVKPGVSGNFREKQIFH